MNLESKGVRLVALASLFGLAAISSVRADVPTDLRLELVAMSRLPTQAQRTSALSNLLPRWVAVDLDTARLTVENWPDESARPMLLGETAWYWGERDVHAALDWAKGLRLENERYAAVRSAIRRFPYEAAREARAEVLRLPAGKIRDKVAEQLVEEFHRGREAAEWCAAYPDAIVAPILVRKVTRSWILTAFVKDANLNAESELIEEWAFELSDIRLREAAFAGALDGFCRLMYYPRPCREPQPIRRLLRYIDDGVLREQLTSEINEAWQKKFPDDVGNPTTVRK